MTKQEEIRELVVKLNCSHWPRDCGLCSYNIDDSGFDQSLQKRKCIHPAIDEFMGKLHSQGVVIKVDRGLPKRLCNVCAGDFMTGEELIQAGYGAFEPLIEVEDDKP